ncbi:MAG: permease [Candidatus Micrarchaeota archaeon]
MSDPLELFAGWIVQRLLGLESGSAAAEALHFFIYDSIKILVLLFAMIFIMGVIRTYVPPAKIKKLLTHKTFGVPNLMASLFGAATPFCSCSSIPIFIGFLEAGVPLGTSLSFLVTSPLVNEYVAVLMLGFFGWEIAASYIVIGILLGTIGGILLGKAGMERYLIKDITGRTLKELKFQTFGKRLAFGFNEAKTILLKLWLWVLVGVGIGAAIHGFVPEELISSAFGAGDILSVPLAVLIGIPIYANCSAVVPIAVVLFQKGAPLGTALSFMMATAALSLPEAIILRRAMKLPLLALFFGMIALGIILIGYLFNLVF